MARLRVVLEFSPKKERDLILYQNLLKYSNPGAVVKDMLYGVLPLPEISLPNGNNDNTEEVE